MGLTEPRGLRIIAPDSDGTTPFQAMPHAPHLESGSLLRCIGACSRLENHDLGRAKMRRPEKLRAIPDGFRCHSDSRNNPQRHVIEWGGEADS
jgi:hypothetical protein